MLIKNKLIKFTIIIKMLYLNYNIVKFKNTKYLKILFLFNLMPSIVKSQNPPYILIMKDTSKMFSKQTSENGSN